MGNVRQTPWLGFPQVEKIVAIRSIQVEPLIVAVNIIDIKVTPVTPEGLVNRLFAINVPARHS